MSPDHIDPTQPPWEQMLRALLGDQADEAIAQMRERGIDPAALDAGGALPHDPAAMQQVLAQVQRLFASGDDQPVNWEMAHDLARQQAAVGGDPALSSAKQREVLDALSVAELWLDAATELPPSTAPARAWSRAEWVEATLPTWRTLTDPVASSLSAALVDALGGQLGDDDDSGLDDQLRGLGLPEGMALPGGLAPGQLLRRLGSAVFGLQVGQAAGTLARDVFGTTDIGLPLLDVPAPALVAANVDAFAEGLDAPVEEVRLFLALREAAATRLFTHVPWLRAHLLALVETYARGISIDVDQLEQAVGSIDPTDAEALQAALSSGVFAPQTTPEQQAALGRLETALALVEGWVDEVSATAALAHLPHSVALREMIRRRRAAGGPAEQAFANLVGLELRPRRLRDAAALWAQIARGPDGAAARDAVWDHPDLMPTAEDLDDPAGYATRRTAAADESADLDRALAEILGEDTPQDEPGQDAPDQNGPDQDGPGQDETERP
ncbi:Hydrolase OS=Cellulomonas persica OX=76861 GN=CPE01_07550 PE=4 SV=1 [Cellulomonas persica]|uniref:Hydrolase n=2 Tax=Cellulomonas persica TaxID=76861 RepID=A0A510UQT0_9CELL|nr:hydrolase [Cellulomonas persica]